MELEYTISNEDSLNGVLFLISQAPLTKKRKFRERILYPAVYFFMGMALFTLSHSVIGLIIILVTLIWVIFYPYISEYSIRKKYLKKSGNQKNADERHAVKLKFAKESLIIIDGSEKSEFMITDIKKIIEIKNYFFLGIKSGGHLTIPKNQIEEGTLNSFIKKIEKKSNADFVQILNWQWK